VPADKLQPRNRTARLADVRAAGNPVVAELEAGVGNCFPGLEADLRNLDRRFFPYLAVDFIGGAVVVVEVVLARAQAELSPGPLLTGLTTMAAAPAGSWQVTAIAGDFAGHGPQAWTIAQLGTSTTRPVDAWTAVRLLRPGTQVQLTLRRQGAATLTLTATRASYLRDDGAFAEMFAPGELTQSLCSPWTHDFRDCGCFYWASNHPDIVQPAVPAGTAPDDPEWTVRVPWLRADRLASPPPVDQQHGGELAHQEINARWQELDVVLDGREQRSAYHPDTVAGTPLDRSALVPTLRYAAGVELAVMLEYLAATFSLDLAAGTVGSALRDDARAARYELLRVAASEMRHLRAVNGLLFSEHEVAGGAGPFAPALGVATVVPEPGGAPGRPVDFRRLTPDVLAYFVQVEAPSKTVDALYGRILATYVRDGQDTQAAAVTQVMAEGADHYATFRTVQEWLARHAGTPYLLALRTPVAGEAALATLQQRYEQVLGLLHDGYRVGIPAGAASIAAARTAMLGPGGVEGACADLATAGVLPVFAVPADARFAAVAPPP
jgi:Ferritin-like